MADTVVYSVPIGNSDERDGCWGPYWINTSKGVVVHIDGGADINYSYTDDGGATWSTTNVFTGNCRQVAAWFDRETPGDTGTLLHFAWVDSDDRTVQHGTVDIDDGTLGTLTDIWTGLTINTNDSELYRVCITKSKSGNLYVGYKTPSDAIDFARSTNGGTSWTTGLNDVYESTTEDDWAMLYPANTADDDDIAAIYWDASASEISVKIWDNSVGTWGGETSILSSMTLEAARRNMDAAIRLSDELIVGIAWSGFDTSTADLLPFTVNANSTSSPTVATGGTFDDVITNQGEAGYCAITINQQNDDIYVAYIAGGTMFNSCDVHYKISDDDMNTWGSEQTMNEDTADDFRLVSSGRTITSHGGRYQPMWYFDDATRAYYINLTNDIEISAAAGGGGAAIPQLSLLGVGL